MLGLSALIAPAPSTRGAAGAAPWLSSSVGSGRTAGGGGGGSVADKSASLVVHLASFLATGRGGIAGGGVFEFDTHTALQILPLAVVFLLGILLSQLSFA
jgi:hypothetical protein